MNNKLPAALALTFFATLNFHLSTTLAQGTAFTYQGRLAANGTPVGGAYDLRFAIYDALVGGTQQGATTTNSVTAVSNGVFTVTLDFGSNVFTGASRWLEVAVRTNGGGAFTALEPRQAVTPTPYALYAASASFIQTTNLCGPLTLAQLPAAVLTNGASGVTLTGNFSGQIVLSGGGSQVYDLGTPHGVPVRYYVQNHETNGLAWVYVQGSQTNRFLEFDPASGVMRSSLSLSATNFAGGGQTLSNIYLTSTANPPFTHPPRGIANWLQYWHTPGNTTNTGPDEPGEAVAFKSILEMSTNGMAAAGNNWLRLDYGWLTNGSVNSDKFPSGLPYLVAFAHSNNCKVQIDFAWDLDVPKDRLAEMVRQVLGFGADGVGIITDIIHYPNRPTMDEFRELIRIANEARLLASAQYGRGSAANHNPALWFSINHNTTDYFVPPELLAVNFFAFEEGVGKLSLRELTDHIRTNYLDLAWLTAPGRYPHCNANDYNEFAGTNIFRQWLSCLAIADCGFWVTDRTGTNLDYLPYLTNQSFYAWLDDPASHGGGVVASSGPTEIWRRPIGELSSGTNLFLFVNAAPDSYAALTLNVTNWPGGVSNRTYVFHDVWRNRDLATFTNALTLTLPPSETFLAAVFPQGTVGNFVGDGSGLTALNAANLTGAIPSARLTSVPAENLTGTVADARLSANVALRNNGNLFLGDQLILAGNVGIGTITPQQRLDVQGNIVASGTVTPNSDRNAKTSFAPVDTADVLSKLARLPIQQWRFQTEPDGVKHFGPMAQDFRIVFGLGAFPTGIATVDADGVALAAIQGLNQKVEDRIQKLEAENAELKRRLETLELRLTRQEHGEK